MVQYTDTPKLMEEICNREFSCAIPVQNQCLQEYNLLIGERKKQQPKKTNHNNKKTPTSQPWLKKAQESSVGKKRDGDVII